MPRDDSILVCRDASLDTGSNRSASWFPCDSDACQNYEIGTHMENYGQGATRVAAGGQAARDLIWSFILSLDRSRRLPSPDLRGRISSTGNTLKQVTERRNGLQPTHSASDVLPS